MGSVVAFWLLVVTAGLVNPGYAPTRDYISALASRGADQAWLGVTALVVLPLAHLSVAVAVWDRARLAAAGLLATVPLGLLVAAMRISCPSGAARCSVAGQVRRTDWLDAVHGKAVAGYGVLMVLVLVAAAFPAGLPWRRGRVASALAAPVSALLLLMSSGGSHPGTPQRLWLIVNTGWLVAVSLAVLVALSVAVRQGGDP
jgi:hypothetical protein